jgi:hypothetical protein
MKRKGARNESVKEHQRGRRRRQALHSRLAKELLLMMRKADRN